MFGTASDYATKESQSYSEDEVKKLIQSLMKQ
jgi:hypothetical protein